MPIHEIYLNGVIHGILCFYIICFVVKSRQANN